MSLSEIKPLHGECLYDRDGNLVGKWNGERGMFADCYVVRERVCRILQAYGDDSEELDNCMEEIVSTPEDTVACICQSCGHEFRYDRMVRPEFCPNCGAKVVSG